MDKQLEGLSNMRVSAEGGSWPRKAWIPCEKELSEAERELPDAAWWLATGSPAIAAARVRRSTRPRRVARSHAAHRQPRRLDQRSARSQARTTLEMNAIVPDYVRNRAVYCAVVAAMQR